MLDLETVFDEMIEHGFFNDDKIYTTDVYDLIAVLNIGDICVASTKVRYCLLNSLVMYADRLYLSGMVSGGVLWKDDFEAYNESSIFYGSRIKEAYQFNGKEFELIFKS